MARVTTLLRGQEDRSPGAAQPSGVSGVGTGCRARCGRVTLAP